jgi:predicted nucleic acid-binding protein
VSWLLDTNVLTELRKVDHANAHVRAWYASTPAVELYTSVLVLGEIRRGVENLRRRDATAALAIEHWLARIVDGFAERVLPVDAEVADQWGRLNAPDPLPAVDGLLAATALVHDMVLVTRNVRNVVSTGVRVLDPTSLTAGGGA